METTLILAIGTLTVTGLGVGAIISILREDPMIKKLDDAIDKLSSSVDDLEKLVNEFEAAVKRL